MFWIVKLSALKVIVPIDNRVYIIGGKWIRGSVIQLLIRMWGLLIAGKPPNQYRRTLVQSDCKLFLNGALHLVDIFINHFVHEWVDPFQNTWPHCSIG